MNRRDELAELAAFISERNDDDSFFGEIFSRFMQVLNAERAKGLSRDDNAFLANLEQTREEDLADYLEEKELVQYLRFAESFADDVDEALEAL